MADSFDPYFEWLGIESGGQPPDHYCLLGLQPYESDRELIGRAADVAMARVRRIRPGTNLAEWSQTLDRLGAAKICLLDPSSKQAYDESISISPIAVQPAPITVMTAKSSGMGQLIAVLAAVAVTLAGLFVYLMCQRDVSAGKSDLAANKPASTQSSTKRSPKESAKPQAEKSDVAKPQAAELEMEKSELEEPEAAKPKTEEPKPEPEKPKTEVDAKMAAAFAQAVTDVRASLAERNLPTASKDLKTASANAQTQEDYDQIDRLQTMIDNLTQFWNGIRTSMAKLQAAEELVLKDMRLSVVESDRNYLTVRAEGRNRRFQTPTLPTPLVMLLVDQYFGKDPGSKAIVGTFLAVDPKGDRALARQYLQEAAKAGIDSEKLLHELDGRAAPAVAE